MKSSKVKAALNVVLILVVVGWSKFGNLNWLLEHYGIQTLHIINFIFLSVLAYVVIKRKRAQWFAPLAIALSTPSILFFIYNPFSAQFSIIYCVSLIALLLIFLSPITGVKNSNPI